MRPPVRDKKMNCSNDDTSGWWLLTCFVNPFGIKLDKNIQEFMISMTDLDTW